MTCNKRNHLSNFEGTCLTCAVNDSLHTRETDSRIISHNLVLEQESRPEVSHLSNDKKLKGGK